MISSAIKSMAAEMWGMNRETVTIKGGLTVDVISIPAQHMDSWSVNDDGQTVAVAVVNTKSKPYPSVQDIRANVRGSGYGRILYEEMAKYYGGVRSSTSSTSKDAEKAWVSVGADNSR